MLNSNLCVIIGNNSHLDFLSDTVSSCELFTDIKNLIVEVLEVHFYRAQQKCLKLTILSCLFYIPFKNKLHLSKQTQHVKIRKSESHS